MRRRIAIEAWTESRGGEGFTTLSERKRRGGSRGPMRRAGVGVERSDGEGGCFSTVVDEADGIWRGRMMVGDGCFTGRREGNKFGD